MNKKSPSLIELPDLGRSYCRHIAACGRVSDDLPAHLKGRFRHVEEEGQELIAYYQSEKLGRIYASSVISFDNKGHHHVHIELTGRQFIPDEFPAPNCKIAVLRKTLSKFDGIAINSKLDALFVLPKAVVLDGEGFIAQLISGLPNTTLVGGEAEFKGEVGFKRINWRLFDDAEFHFFVEFDHWDLALTERYLDIVFNLVNAVFLSTVDLDLSSPFRKMIRRHNTNSNA